MKENITQRQQEYEFIRNFILGASLDEENARDQLRALWTAYCFHYGLDVDTAEYDSDLADIWERVRNCEEADTADWSDFNSFDNFMAKLLV